MNDLLFYLIILALLYYFFYYLPQQKKTVLPPPTPQPFTHQKEIPAENKDNPLNGPGPVIEFPSAQSQPLNQEDPELEKTLDHLIASLRDFNQQLETNPTLTELYQARTLAQKKLASQIPWESWETKKGITNYLQELENQIKILENQQ